MLQMIKGDGLKGIMNKIKKPLLVIVLMSSVAGLSAADISQSSGVGVGMDGNHVQQESMIQPGGGSGGSGGGYTIDTSGQADTQVKLSTVMEEASKILNGINPEVSSEKEIKKAMFELRVSLGSEGSENLMKGLNELINGMAEKAGKPVPKVLTDVLDGGISDVDTQVEADTLISMVNAFDSIKGAKDIKIEVNGESFKQIMKMNKGEMTQAQTMKAYEDYKKAIEVSKQKASSSVNYTSDMGMN